MTGQTFQIGICARLSKPEDQYAPCWQTNFPQIETMAAELGSARHLVFKRQVPGHSGFQLAFAMFF